ncbi:hypothetical protein [Natronohydrobacter thiooxidans]|jgi:membrane protein YdbS with pleckstrin-like domain|uniref:hypothetical protein n=1 Tax=Natronohydrobacter thiooxidans TaxID=87172 RepID=UPI000A9BE2C3|nr:hypothetical protein [Natronohydrobacter thiooxidans]
MLIIQFALAICTGMIFAIAAVIGDYGFGMALLIYSLTGAVTLVLTMVATMLWSEWRSA